MKSIWIWQKQTAARITFFRRHFLNYSRCSCRNQRAKLIHISLATFASFRIQCLCFYVYSERSWITHTLPSNAMQIKRKWFVVWIEIYLVLFVLKCKTILLSVLKGNVWVFPPLRCTNRIPRNDFIVCSFRIGFCECNCKIHWIKIFDKNKQLYPLRDRFLLTKDWK